MSRDKISGKRRMRELLPRIIPLKIFLPWLVLDSRLAASTRGNYNYKKGKFAVTWIIETALLDNGDNGKISFWMPIQPKASFGTESQVNVRVNA